MEVAAAGEIRRSARGRFQEVADQSVGLWEHRPIGPRGVPVIERRDEP
ncbi:hypothetical protein GA0115240_154211, partial [Streptomyces sp. DvalAA-14]